MKFPRALELMLDGHYMSRNSEPGSLYFVEGHQLVRSNEKGCEEANFTSEQVFADDWHTES